MKTIIAFLMALAVAFVAAPNEVAAQVESGYSVKGTSNSQFLHDVQVDGEVYIGDANSRTGASNLLEFRDTTGAILLPSATDSSALDSFYLGQLMFFKVDSTVRYYDGVGWRAVSRN